MKESRLTGWGLFPSICLISPEYAGKLVWITPQCGVIRACYLELGGRSSRPATEKYFVLTNWQLQRIWKLALCLGRLELLINYQIPHPRHLGPPRHHSVLILTCTTLLVPGPYTLSAVETRQVENWSKYWVLHKIWRANIFSGREYQLQDLHPLHPAVRDWIYTNANFIYYVFFISVLLYTYFL